MFAREPTDLSPVERVDAAGGAVVNQSCLGPAGRDTQREEVTRKVRQLFYQRREK